MVQDDVGGLYYLSFDARTEVDWDLLAGVIKARQLKGWWYLFHKFHAPVYVSAGGTKLLACSS